MLSRVSSLIKYVGIVITIIALVATQTTPLYSLSEEQKRIFDTSIYYYDVEPSTLSQTGSCLAGNTNEEKMWNFFISKGLNPEQAAGVMGNLSIETGGTYSPTIQERAKEWPSGGWGIAQWTNPGRRDAIRDAVLEAGLPYTDQDLPPSEESALLEFQLNYLYEESKNRTMRDDSSTNEWDGLLETTSIEEASIYWQYNYERPASLHPDDRIRESNDIFARLGSVSGETTCSVNGDLRELAQIILDSPNVSSDHEDQLRNIVETNLPCPAVSESYTIDPELLRVVATLAQDNTFTISSLHRGCTSSTVGAGSASRHWAGKAVDISGSRPINGDTMNGFGGYSSTIQDFINQASALLPEGCELGVPNQRYVSNTEKFECNAVFEDSSRTTGATGPHVHIGVPR